MKPVMQTNSTNCFRACVASILELDIEAIPECCDGAEDKWNFEKFQKWLKRYGLQAIEITLSSVPSIAKTLIKVPCIITGKSPRNQDIQHAVVASAIDENGFTLLHDPHEDNLFIKDGELFVTFLVPTRPERVIREN